MSLWLFESVSELSYLRIKFALRSNSADDLAPACCPTSLALAGAAAASGIFITYLPVCIPIEGCYFVPRRPENHMARWCPLSARDSSQRLMETPPSLAKPTETRRPFPLAVPVLASS